MPPRPPVNEDTLRTERIQVERKTFVFTLKENPRGRFLRINRALAARYGLADSAQAVGKTDFDFYPPADAERFRRDEEEILRSGRPAVACEEHGTFPDGKAAWTSTTKMPLRDADSRNGTFVNDRKVDEARLVDGCVVRLGMVEFAFHQTEPKKLPVVRRPVVLAGDRGMLTETQLETLRQFPGVGWISALRGPAIRALVESGSLQLSLFDAQNLAEITVAEYPGERLIACFNPLLAEERRRTRQELLAATEKAFGAIAREVARRRKTPLTAAEIGVKVGRVRNRFKVGKHFALTIEDGGFCWARQEDAIGRETALDGIYVIRTSEPAAQLSAADTVRTYKRLAVVERAFRCLKGSELRVRPIHHRTATRVRAHFFLCLLAYYVEWHMREALRPLLFDDEHLDQDRRTRDPVAPARSSPSAPAPSAGAET
jgi:hypothetical protein